MSGVRKVIYVPSQELWDEIKEAAERERRSASNYLIWLHDVNIGMAASETKPEISE